MWLVWSIWNVRVGFGSIFVFIFFKIKNKR